MPYDKFEQAAPIEVLPNIQPQVDESMIRAVQTASQAFEARAKRKQEEEQAASAAKAAERKRLLEIKVPTETSPIAAIQNAMTQVSNEAYNAALQGQPTALYEAQLKDLEGKGQSLTQFTTNIGGVMTKAKEKYGAAFETPKESEEWISVISNPNASIDEVFQVKNKLESKLATPYKTLNFGKYADIWLDKNKNEGYATNIQRGLTTTGQTIQSRIWFTDKTKPLVINGVTQKDANGDVIYEQRPPANREETNEAALKFLQSEDGAVGTMLSQKIQEEDAKSINDELNTAIEEYKKANWNAPMAKPSEPSETWKEAAKKGIIDRKVVEAAKDFMWDNQQAYVSAYGVTKKEPSKAAGASAGEKVKVGKTSSNVNEYSALSINPDTKKPELMEANSMGYVKLTDEKGKDIQFNIRGKVTNRQTNETESLTSSVPVKLDIIEPLIYNKNTNGVMHVRKGETLLDFVKRQPPQYWKDHDIQPYARLVTKNKDGLFNESEAIDSDKLSEFTAIKQKISDGTATNADIKRKNELTVEFKDKSQTYAQPYKNIVGDVQGAGAKKGTSVEEIFKNTEFENDYKEAQRIIAEQKRKLSGTSTKVETPKTGGTKTQFKGVPKGGF